MSNRLQVGENIGDYKILGFLGAGGMGAVYQGVHTKINRLAAIKVLNSGGSDSTFVRRFFNEARLQSSLHHPNIATLYDFQESVGRLFIIMEYVDGETLEALIKRRYFAVEDALKTFETICEAVAFIHGNNIIHRDIKPQNIKLSLNGTVKLLDFGIAKDSISQGLTRIGGVVGTPNYLAPEQLSGKPATPRSDIWALGVLFYEMLTGTEPFRGNTFGELHMQITTGKFEPPENVNPAVTTDVSRIVFKCLEKKPDERYQTVSELIGDIKRSLNKFQRFTSVGSYRHAQVFPAKGKPGRPPVSGGQLPSASAGDKEGLENSEKKKSGITGVLTGAAAALVLLSAIVGFSIWAMGEGAEANGSKSSDSQTTGAPEPGFGQPDNSTLAKNDKTIAAQPGSRHEAQNAGLTIVKVELVAGSAQVFREGQFIGTTPLEIKGYEKETVGLTLKRDGYRDKDVQIEIVTRRKVYTFSMERNQ